ncbi:hypothetical protein PA7_40880 [Pseudonocardia asaccharolytica DSM 44247 = NBRC 16224]|uniref:Uncharacterized protein n=1 Tax=Pseudonocardia asaccharolytica DSM 44247 = NBRC 16224 TaxID=1123024 RepID=A0A511D635_9PSEU|nr:hypothetical protein PA7_40880 [Pseudonocardia asaccharolytica DSM 44247 = NBRC 16224]
MGTGCRVAKQGALDALAASVLGRPGHSPAFYVDLLAERGPLLGEPYARQLDESFESCGSPGSAIIALWLGHAGVRSTAAYVHANISRWSRSGSTTAEVVTMVEVIFYRGRGVDESQYQEPGGA